MNNFNLLLAWLNASGFAKEASELFLVREAAGKPLRINRADVDEIVEELIQSLGAILMAYGIPPVNLILLATGQLGLPPGLDETLQVSVERKRKDVVGREFLVTYYLMFSDDPSLPPALVRSPPGGDKTLVLGFNPNGLLSKAVDKYVRSNIAAIKRDANNPLKSFKHLDGAIRDYLREIIRHEEVHVLDHIPLAGKRRFNRPYVVKDPSGEEFAEIAKKLQVNLLNLLSDNEEKILVPTLTTITPEDIDDAVKAARETGSFFGLDHALNRVGKIRLPKGTELKVVRLGTTQALSKQGDTLRSVARKNNIDPLRILVINFNRVLNNTGRPFSFEEIYNFPQKYKESFLDLELPDNTTLAILPSYEQLYSEYHDFYLLTREESKAHYEQAIFNIQKATEGMSDKDINSLTLDQMIGLSPVAVKYKKLLKVKPVDKIIKTPIDGKTIERLKQERYKDFMQRMWYYWSEVIRSKPEEIE